ncbi:MAG TPA: hypothetical protein VLH10_21890 [Yinghuangia sp.]|nr:hypothetical protein [Yinghuangia sp.]
MTDATETTATTEPTAPTLLRVLVARRHWQVYETFRHHYERAAATLAEREGDQRISKLTVSKRQFERWYGGELKTRPYPDQCRVLETMFGIPVDELLGPAPLSVEEPRSSVFTGVDGPWADLGVGERERQVAMAARRAFRFSSSIEGSSVGAETLDQLGDEVRRIAAVYPQLPLPTLLGDLVELQDTSFRFLEQGRIRPIQARELYMLAGMASGMLAKASHDLGDPRSAMTQARTAYVCAENADHPALRAWARGLQSLITYWSGQPHEAARYAALGTATAQGLRGTTTVWLACLAARAHAILGDVEAAKAAAARAEDARSALRLDDLDAYGGIMTFPTPRQLYYTAEASVHLGDDHRAAETQALAAVRAYREAQPEEWAFSDEAGAHTNLALARVASDEVDGAADAVRPVLDLPVEQRNFGIVTSARRVHDALCAPRFRGARAALEVRSEIQEFSAFSTAAVLR